MSDTDEQLVDRYVAGLSALLPKGPFWAGFSQPGGQGNSIIRAKAEGCAAVHRRADQLVKELNPLNAVETLAAREREAGLPDPCLPANLTTEERRLHLVARWRQDGSQHISYFERICADLGYDVTITEHRPFRCGYSECGGSQFLGDETIRHFWVVTVHEPRINYFRCGQSQLGVEPLGFVRRAEDLECALARVEPAHMKLQFNYEGL